jgi:hypothetical protein
MWFLLFRFFVIAPVRAHSGAGLVFLAEFFTHGLDLQFVFSTSKGSRCPLLRLHFHFQYRTFEADIFLPPLSVPTSRVKAISFSLLIFQSPCGTHRLLGDLVGVEFRSVFGRASESHSRL